MSKFNELDTVILKEKGPKRNASAGQIGTILEDYGKGEYEVEFCDDQGVTTALGAYNEKQLQLHTRHKKTSN